MVLILFISILKFFLILFFNLISNYSFYLDFIHIWSSTLEWWDIGDCDRLLYKDWTFRHRIYGYKDFIVISFPTYFLLVKLLFMPFLPLLILVNCMNERPHEPVNEQHQISFFNLTTSCAPNKEIKMSDHVKKKKH